MRTKRRLQAAALTAVAVVLGLFTVQGTYALWSAAALPSDDLSVTTMDSTTTNSASSREGGP